MISLILIIFASIMNAIMDTHVHHFAKSIFPKFGNSYNYFFVEDSWRNKYIDRDPSKGFKKLWIFNYPVQITDLWHFCKTIMIFALCGAMVLYKPMVNPFVDFVILGMSWNIFFSLFYDKILIVKTK